MKSVLKILLGVLFVPLFLVLTVLITTKFYVLDLNFLTNIYDEQFFKKTVEIVKKQAPEFNIDPVVVKEFADKNIANIIDFFDGNNPKFLVYIPKQLGFTFAGGEVSLPTLLSRYSQLDDAEIQKIYYFENLSFYLSIAIGVIIFLIILIFWFAKQTFGVYLIVAGGVTLLIAQALNLIKNQWTVDLIPKNEGIAIIGVPLMAKVYTLWFYYSLITILVGVIVLIVFKFLKKIK